MKIVFLQDDFPPSSFGGAGISTYELAVGMHRAGHEISVITTCRKVSDAGVSTYDGLTVHRIHNNYPGRWRSYLGLYNPPVIRRVEALLQEIRPDVVHANNVHFYLSYRVLKIAKRYAAGVVMTFRDVMPFNFAKLTTKRYLEQFDCHTTWRDHVAQAGKRWNPFRNPIIRHYLKYPDKLFAVSEALKEALRQNGIGNVEVLHTGASILEWQTSHEEVTRFKNTHGLNNKRVVLIGGRLSGAKGNSQLFKAMRVVARDVPDAVLVIAAHADVAEMEHTARQLGLHEKLVFTGWIEREEMKNAYASADVVVVPSICFDSFPRIVLEAMACGKPVVGTCYGGTPEIIVDGVTGYIVNPFNASSMSGKIIDLLSNPSKARQFGDAGRKRVGTDFNQDKKINTILECYHELLNH